MVLFVHVRVFIEIRWMLMLLAHFASGSWVVNWFLESIIRLQIASIFLIARNMFLILAYLKCAKIIYFCYKWCKQVFFICLWQCKLQLIATILSEILWKIDEAIIILF